MANMFYLNLTLSLGTIGDIMEHSFLINYLKATSDNIHVCVVVALFLSFLWIIVAFINNNCEPDNEPKSYKPPIIICIIAAILAAVIPTAGTFEKETPQKLQIETQCRK